MMLNGVLADTIKDAAVSVAAKLAHQMLVFVRLRSQNSLAHAIGNHQIQLDRLTQI